MIVDYSMPFISGVEGQGEQANQTLRRQVRGLYVSVLPSGVATFCLKFTDPNTHKRSSIKVGVYHRETFNVDRARIKAMALRARIGNGEDVAQAHRQAKARQAKLSGVSVDQMIDQYVAWIQAPVRKPDGEMPPRLESWGIIASQLRRFVSPRLGRMMANEVTNRDIAQLSDDIVAGRIGGKASLSNARHVRKGASGLFKWAAQPSRAYVDRSPCHDLEPLDREHPRTRVLSDNEIRTLWHGLDRDNLPWDRKIRLALKFSLVSMLRSGELLPIHRSELAMEDSSGNFCVNIPFKRLKTRKHRSNPQPMKQPLSDLAMQIIREAVTSSEQQYVFEVRSIRASRGIPCRRHCAAPSTRRARPRHPASASCSASSRSRRMICEGPQPRWLAACASRARRWADNAHAEKKNAHRAQKRQESRADHRNEQDPREGCWRPSPTVPPGSDDRARSVVPRFRRQHACGEYDKDRAQIRKDPARKLIVIDPRRTETAEMADLHLAVRPGADTFLLGALLATLVRSDRVDQAFIEEHTIGFAEVRQALLDIPVEEWAAAADISIADLERCAAMIAAAKAMVVRVELGIQQGINSTLNSYLEKLLIMLSGNFGRKGTNQLHSWLQPLWGNSPNQTFAPTGAAIIGGLLPPNIFPKPCSRTIRTGCVAPGSTVQIQPTRSQIPRRWNARCARWNFAL